MEFTRPERPYGVPAVVSTGSAYGSGFHREGGFFHRTGGSAGNNARRSRSRNAANRYSSHPLSTTPLSPPVSPHVPWPPILQRLRRIIDNPFVVSALAVLFVVWLAQLTNPRRVYREIKATDISEIPFLYQQFAKLSHSKVNDGWFVNRVSTNISPTRFWHAPTVPDWLKQSLDEWDDSNTKVYSDFVENRKSIRQMLNNMNLLTSDLVEDMKQVRDDRKTETDVGTRPTTQYLYQWNGSGAWCMIFKCRSKIEMFRALYIKYLKQLSYGSSYSHGGQYSQSSRQFTSIVSVLQDTKILSQKLETLSKKNEDFVRKIKTYASELAQSSPGEAAGKSTLAFLRKGLERWKVHEMTHEVKRREQVARHLDTSFKALEIIYFEMLPLLQALHDPTNPMKLTDTEDLNFHIQSLRKWVDAPYLKEGPLTAPSRGDDAYHPTGFHWLDKFLSFNADDSSKRRRIWYQVCSRLRKVKKILP